LNNLPQVGKLARGTGKYEMVKWMHWIEAIVGAVILFAGLYLSF
jgi:hypothetical protein